MERQLDLMQRKLNILIVDDIMKNLQVIGNILLEEGFEIAMATNGKDALEMTKNIQPDLILLDVMMPDMNGYQVCEELKKNKELAIIPVIFLTAKSDTDDIIQGFEIGGVDYVTKPFKREELLVRIRTHLELKISRDIILTQNDKLKELNKEKNEFLGITAHDLKNPISAIMGMSDLLLRDDMEFDPEEVLDFIKDMNTSSRQMFQLVTDLLDINAIEEGKINLNPSQFTAKELCESVVGTYQMRAGQKDIILLYEAASEEDTLYADTNKSRQILDNLVSNAVKFSPYGKKVLVKSYAYNDEMNCVEVKDEGPGLNENDISKLFGKFQKLTAQPTGKENSTGLGLSIVKRLVEEMGGDIWCESTLGEGCSFKLILPKKEKE